MTLKTAICLPRPDESQGGVLVGDQDVQEAARQRSADRPYLLPAPSDADHTY